MWKHEQPSLPAVSPAAPGASHARRVPGMRERLLLAFAVLIAIVLAVLWLTQTVLMDRVYTSVKYRELHQAVSGIAEALAAGEDRESRAANASGEAAALADKYNLCLSVYAVNNGYGTLIAEEHTNLFCLIHNVPSDTLLNRLYRLAGESEDGYTEEVSMAETLGRRESTDRTRTVLCARLVRLPGVNGAGESEYFVLLNTELVPISTTISTLRLQMVWLTVLLIAVAAVLAAVISSHFTRPLVDMSREAASLAMGNYAVHFDGGGCRETVQLSETLNHAAYELSRLDKMQKDLIANISHDLRTPLTMIEGYSEVIRDLPGEATPENMQIIIDETRRLTSLVNDMLEVSRYQSGTQILHPAPVNFTALLRQTIDRYDRLREREGYTICLEADTDVWASVDETRILQVLYNLINNAVNYTGADKRVVVRQEVQGDEVTVSVIDTGDGIPEDQLPLVWERYYKVHDFHKRANMGTGLGLSIVKNILILHGARFGVRSTVGQGSTFWFALKTIPPQTADEPAGEDNTQPSV